MEGNENNCFIIDQPREQDKREQDKRVKAFEGKGYSLKGKAK